MFPFRDLYLVSLFFDLLNGSLAISTESSPLKIIVHMGFGTRSHIKGMLEVASILNQRNHTILYASVVENEKFGDGYSFDFKPLGSVEKLNRNLLNYFETYINLVKLGQDIPPSLPANVMSDIMVMPYEIVFPTLKELVQGEQPDLIICDFFSPACGDVAELQKIPFVTGYQTTDGFGIVTASYITPSGGYGPITIDEQTFLERFQGRVINSIKYKFKPDLIAQRLNKVKEDYGVPSSWGVFKDYHRNLGLATTFEGFEPVMPLPPNIKVIGPVFSDSVPELDTSLKTYLDSHQRVLYMGFGSKGLLLKDELDKLMQSLLILIEDDIIDGIVWGLGLFGQHSFNESFSFKGSQVSTEFLFSSNFTQLNLLNWAPQVPILNHPNTKLFLSHGGLESVLESIHAGRPLLVMSIDSDQPRNARKVEDIGIGLYTNRYNFTSESLVSQVKTILEDKDNSFSSNVARLKAVSKFSSRRKELAADLVEGYVYTAKACRPIHPPQWGEVPCEALHMVPASTNMSFIKSDLLDVYFTAFLILLSSISLTLFTVFKLSSAIYSRLVSVPSHKKEE